MSLPWSVNFDEELCSTVSIEKLAGVILDSPGNLHFGIYPGFHHIQKRVDHTLDQLWKLS